MRPSGILLTVVFAFVALAFTVWIGRYSGQAPEAVTKLLTTEKPVGPAIADHGPYPKAVTDETEYDFGVMMPGGKGEHDYIIRNEGEADLELMARKEDTTCSCTFGKLSKDGALKPGESTTVTLNWHIKIPAGEFRHRAIVRTNDPERKEIELVVHGKVESPLKLQPEGTWNLGEFLNDKPVEMQGALFSTHLKEFAIKSVKADSPVAVMSYEPMTTEQLEEYKATSGYMIKATVKREMPMGPFSTNAHIETEIEDAKEIAFELKGVRPGPIEILGPGFFSNSNALLMGEFPASEGKTSTLSLFTRDIDEDLELERAEQTFDTVKIELTKDPKSTGSARRYLLKVTVPPGEPQDRQRKMSEKINLIFRNKDVPPLRMYVDFLAV